jgi:hypothetical protein
MMLCGVGQSRLHGGVQVCEAPTPRRNRTDVLPAGHNLGAAYTNNITYISNTVHAHMFCAVAGVGTRPVPIDANQEDIAANTKTTPTGKWALQPLQLTTLPAARLAAARPLPKCCSQAHAAKGSLAASAARSTASDVTALGCENRADITASTTQRHPIKHSPLSTAKPKWCAHTMRNHPS